MKKTKVERERLDIGSKLPVKMTGYNVVGIDLSMRSTGLVTMTGDGFIDAWSIPTNNQMGTQLERQSFIVDHILTVLNNFESIEEEAMMVAIEGYAMGVPGGRGQFFTLGELGGIVKHALRGEGYTVGILPPSSLKQFATSKGNAKKPDMAASAYRKYGIRLENDDKIDAAFLAIAAYNFLLERDFPGKYDLGEKQRIAISNFEFATVAKMD